MSHTPTADEILTQNWHIKACAPNQQALDSIYAAMKQIAELTWVSAVDYEYASNYGAIPTTSPNKEQFIKQLFPNVV